MGLSENRARERASRAAEHSTGSVGSAGFRSTQGARIRRQLLGSLFTMDFAQSWLATTAESALLCVLSDSADSLRPALAV